MGGCLDEALRVLKPGGLLFITVPFDHLFLAIQAIFESWPKAADKAGIRFYQWRYSKKDLARELTNHGFDVEELCPISRRQTIVRMLHRSTGLHYDSKLARLIGLILGMVMPRSFCSHMIMAVARKPQVPGSKAGD
ncbi:MAG: hypothetical protein GDA49_08410 [Rhodospirillales bacterium]|nr:hypothetical protein [Rhodospirillales bacterium]